MANSALGNIEILVTPEELVNKSQEVTNYLNKLKDHFDRLRTTVAKSEWYWIGEAGLAHRKTYTDFDKHIEELISRLNEHPRDLTAIAQQYSDIEIKIEEIATALPGDILL